MGLTNILTCAKIKMHRGLNGLKRSRLRCEVVSGFKWPCLTLLFSRALAVMGSLALAGVQMAVESVGVMILPVT